MQNTLEIRQNTQQKDLLFITSIHPCYISKSSWCKWWSMVSLEEPSATEYQYVTAPPSMEWKLKPCIIYNRWSSSAWSNSKAIVSIVEAFVSVLIWSTSLILTTQICSAANFANTLFPQHNCLLKYRDRDQIKYYSEICHQRRLNRTYLYVQELLKHSKKQLAKSNF